MLNFPNVSESLLGGVLLGRWAMKGGGALRGTVVIQIPKLSALLSALGSLTSNRLLSSPREGIRCKGQTPHFDNLPVAPRDGILCKGMDGATCPYRNIHTDSYISVCVCQVGRYLASRLASWWVGR